VRSIQWAAAHAATEAAAETAGAQA
jgi:hypothetical protein